MSLAQCLELEGAFQIEILYHFMIVSFRSVVSSFRSVVSRFRDLQTAVLIDILNFLSRLNAKIKLLDLEIKRRQSISLVETSYSFNYSEERYYFLETL